MTANARALLAGTFRFRHPDPSPLDSRRRGTTFVEFFVETANHRERARGSENQLAIAYGALARTIATTFRDGDFTAISGTMRRAPGPSLPLTVVEATCADRIELPTVGPPPTTLNIVSVVGIVDDSRNAQLHDGTFAKVLSVASETFRDGRVIKDSHPVVLAQAAFPRLPAIAVGDTVRIDGSLRFQRIGRQHFWAVSCTRLLHLERTLNLHPRRALTGLARES